MARKKQTGPTHATEVEAALDEDLTYHVGMILSYTKRNPLETLHTKHQGDPIFEFFGMTSLEFTKKRWAAGFANSCATNLGRFAEKATTTMLSVAFGLTAPQLLKTLTITANEVVETEATDGVLLVDEVQPDSRDRLKKVASRLSNELSSPFDAKGIGFEIRGRYGKNDDTLLQKDRHMAQAIQKKWGAVPVLATFSINNAPGFQKLAGSWVIRASQQTIDLLAELTNVNLIDYLKSRKKILEPVKKLLTVAVD